MTARKIVDVPDSIFDDEAPSIEPTALEKFLGRARDPKTGKLIPKKKRVKTTASSSFDRTIVETRTMVEGGDWEGCAARHIVALFVLMHEKTYGVVPTMSGKERYSNTGIAGGFVRRVFAGDMDKALDYLRWLWTREIANEKWRRENSREGRRLSFGAMVSGALVDDYRVAMARRR
jgi:hypothetical protein